MSEEDPRYPDENLTKLWDDCIDFIHSQNHNRPIKIAEMLIMLGYQLISPSDPQSKEGLECIYQAVNVLNNIHHMNKE